MGQVFADDEEVYYLVRWRGCTEADDSYAPESFFIERGVKNPILLRWLRRVRPSAPTLVV